MPGNLYNRIRQAIAQPVHGEMFERCAVDLLREVYPSLRPVEGGNDAGMDGVGELLDGTPFFLVATVQEDTRGNLQRNARSHIDAGGGLRAVVLATTRPISGRRRIELARLLREDHDVVLVAVHDQADFVDRLYRNAAWRLELLGIPGEARALSQLPATRRPMPEVSLIGRDHELDQLRATGGDLIIVGKPGIGKTYLLQQLVGEEWGLFDNDWSIDHLENDIRDMQPRRIIVDDAHLQVDRLTRLRQLRGEMAARFALVAVTWPGGADEVAGLLPGATRITIGELERNEILRVIEEMGIAGSVALQAHLINQAQGRVGLAVTLAHAAMTQELGAVIAGDVLLRDIVGWYTTSIGPGSRDVLGFLALSGRDGATLDQVCQALGLTPSTVAGMIRGLASGGTLDEVQPYDGTNRLRVQPEELRYSLVRDVYLSGAGSLSLSAAISHLDSPSTAAIPLLGAMHGGVELNREFVRDLVGTDCEAAVYYALLGRTELRQALQQWPHCREEIIREAHRREVDPAETLRLLLESAVGNPHPEHTTPEHPLQVLADRIAASNQPVEIRRSTVEAIDDWLRDGGDSGVGIRALAHVMRPQMRRTEIDPRTTNTLILMQAPLEPEQVMALDSLWDHVLAIVERATDAPMAPLINELNCWVYPETLGFDNVRFEAAERAIRSVTPRVIQQLATILSGHPGALRQLKTYGAEFGLEITVPHDFAVLFPEHWSGSSQEFNEWEQSADAAVVALASEVGSRPLEAQAELLHESDVEAASAGISYPRLTPRLAQLVARSSTEPLVLTRLLAKHGASADLLLPFLEQCVDANVAGWRDTLLELIESDAYSSAALQVVLTHPVGEKLATTGLARLTRRHRSLIHWLVARGGIDATTIERLLDAPERIVARDAAVAIAITQGPIQVSSLSPAGQTRWREVIITSPADEFGYSQILRGDPELFGDWLRCWFTRLQGGSTEERVLPRTLREGIGELPLPLRRGLIDAIPSGILSFFLQDAATELVGQDLSNAQALFDRPDLEDIHWVCLRKGPSEAWMERALLALNRGWPLERVVLETMHSESSWVGEESHHWQVKVDAFSQLGRGNDALRNAIIDAGVQAFSRLRDRSAAREHEERVFGLGHRGP